MKTPITILILGLILPFGIKADVRPEGQLGEPGISGFCRVYLKGNQLIMENTRMARVYEWNNGNLISRSIEDKQADMIWTSTAKTPDMNFPGEADPGVNGSFTVVTKTQTSVSFEHVEATVLSRMGNLEIKRVFRVFPDCPAIACEVYLRGEASQPWTQEEVNAGDMKNVENNETFTSNRLPVLEKIEFPGKHWKIRTVEFLDITDRHNTLVYPHDVYVYRNDLSLRGNMLFATDQVSGNGYFILKESPASMVQLAYPGCDFIVRENLVRLVGLGLPQADLIKENWVRCYGFVTGVYGGSEALSLLSLRDYQEKIRHHDPARDEMIMMNTWGDRGQDKKINEAFAMHELEAGERLGITHFQLDDGWQSGKSGNSAFGGSFQDIWRNPDYWKPDPEKFPDGLAPLVAKGKEKNIRICLWFNPDHENGYRNWEKDADVMMELFKEYDISVFKIDGVKLPTKEAEVNFRRMLDKVMEESQQQVVFNLDVTADRRGGYHYLNEYGNIFLENRYTDWQNYYPYWTLRNLWMLSSWVPAQSLQIEFLNKWRNRDKYDGDPFAPAAYSFDYLFATTMAAQPLAWFEGTGLPEEAFAEIGDLMHQYRKIQADLHKGKIFPIGTEPSGRSWTGFQSIAENSGYFIIYREANDQESCDINTWLPKGSKVELTSLFGSGSSFSATVNDKQEINFRLPEKNSFGVYKYTLVSLTR